MQNIRLVALVTALVLPVGLAGCTDIRQTDPDRTANEQLLISTAADKAIAEMDFSGLGGRSVFLDTEFFESYDKPYVVGTFRSRIAELGGNLASERRKADIVVEIRSGALSINQELFYVGIGGFEVPVPLSEAVDLPLATIYEDFNRTAIAKFAAVTLSAEEGRLIEKVGPVYGLAWIDQDAILGLGWDTANTLPKDVQNNLRPKE
ncbi:MAG: DUF6655 family protein [Alphaproteobacteria bacterium]|nr:DUF6655 family protein [Alphaproteobacteria bacterium]